MDETQLSPNSRKRPAPEDHPSPQPRPLNVNGNQFLPTPPDTDGSSNASPTCDTNQVGRDPSPAPSSSTLTSMDVVGNDVNDGPSTIDSGSTARPAKRRKLTPAEKEQQRIEKAAKDAEKAVLRGKKDEEKRVKDEEKRKKAEDREAKKREKELDEERKAQDKLKKERAQMRLGAFFQKPATPVKISEDGEVLQTTARRKSLSLEPFDAVADLIRNSQSPSKVDDRTPLKPTASDYSKYFLPFQLQVNHFLAPGPQVEDVDKAQSAFDRDIADPSLREKYNLGLVDTYASLERQFASDGRASRGIPLLSTRLLVEKMQGTPHQPIDLTKEVATDTANPMEALKSMSVRHVEFEEDVRPAFFGTYTKIRSPRTMRKLCLNPLTRARPDTNYDEDSEAEWEEPEDGDDECIEDEAEAESQADAEEFDEFLDDEEEAVKGKRKAIVVDLTPMSTGLCWEDQTGRVVSTPDNADTNAMLLDMRIGVLLPNFSGATIDPFSTTYWDGLKVDVTTEASSTAMRDPTVLQWPNLMAPPPRTPLQPRAANASPEHALVGAAEGMTGPITTVAATQASKPKAKVPPKPLSEEDLEEFKEAVVGSQANKVDLIKGLKLRFPKLILEVIRKTLGDHFAQVGSSKAEKKWVFVTAT